MRNGRIPIENLSGGELTSAPLLHTPSKYSRLLKNFYINSEGHIKKVPGWSAISQQVTDIKITSGIDFKKSDGTSIILVGGRVNSGVNQNTVSFTAGALIPPPVFTGSGVDDVTSGGTFSGTANCKFTIEVTQQGDGANSWDEIRYCKDSGAWTYRFLSDPDLSSPKTIALWDGVEFTIDTNSGHTVGDKWTITIIYPPIDDLVPSGTCTASGVTDFDVEIDSIGDTDTFKWRKNAGTWTTGVAITGAAQDLSDSIVVTFKNTTGHAYGSAWAITSSPIMGAVYRLDYGILSAIKSDFASLDPIYFSQIGDTVIMSNNSDRPVSYDGTSISNVNVPFGNSIEFAGSGLNDFSVNITFAYASNTYEVEIDAVGAMTITPDYTGTGKNDLAVPSPNFSGDAATATFDVIIDGVGSGDTFKYNINSGVFVTGNALTSLDEGTSIAGVARLKAGTTVGHSRDDYYEFQIVSATLFKYRKNGGAWSADTTLTTYPTYAGIGDGYSIAFDETPTVGDIYKIQVDGATTPDTYKWRKDAGTWTTGVSITGPNAQLSDGIFIRFAYFTGHVSDSDTWAIEASRDTIKYRNITEAWTTGVLITGAFQEIVAGVQFKFSAINGHTLADKWTIPITQNVRLGKSYTYKGRTWAIGNDRLTAYHSVLNLPSDFVGDGSGYLDFRYVIPKGDELLDISSVLNYLVFFFKNHIIVYAGIDPTTTGDFAIQQSIDDLGVMAAGCVVPVGSDIFFLTTRGIKGLKQVLNTGALDVNNISSPIDQDIVDTIAADTSGVYSSAHYQKLGLVLFQIGNTIFLYNYRNNSWSRIIVPSVNDVSKILSMFQCSNGELYMGGYDYLFQFDPAEITYNFNDQAPAYQWTGPMWKATTAESMFLTEMVLRMASTAAATLILKVRAVGFDMGVEDQAAFNQQTLTVSAITTNDAVFNFVRTALDGAGKYIQIDISETPTYISNGDVEIAAVEINGELGIL